MSVIVNIILQHQEHAYSPIQEQIVQSVLFTSPEEGKEFADGFGQKFLCNGTESRYVAKLINPLVGATVDLIYTVSIENGQYVMNNELVTGYQIENNPAMSEAFNNPNSAFALTKNGEVVELTNGDVGVRTFYTMDSCLAEDLNAENE